MLSLCVIVPDWYVIYNNQEENSDNICKLSLSMLLLQITENIGYSIRKQDLINALNLGRSIEAFIMIICFQKSDIYIYIYIYSALYRILQVQDMVLISDGYFVTLMFFFFSRNYPRKNHTGYDRINYPLLHPFSSSELLNRRLAAAG
jgi:hypothetical protein